ncbi:hypothetical protein MFIFM68171_02306 [Madurella fahalii]|uniref:Aminoglycoside phosphotransferase domain-containing protein n=1 Tax=Madurella fahalii TaxID=1157608 RepID=A0ABQ0G2V6_9PEZI
MAFRVSNGIAAKATIEQHILAEYPTLAYLQQHLPDFPAPRLHGVVRIGTYGLLFTTYIPGLDLEKAWPKLGDAEKRSISSQLDVLLQKLRSFPLPENSPLGGVSGQGCKDGRRAIRVSSEPILDIKEFQNFIFAGSKTASPIYTQFLRELMPAAAKAAAGLSLPFFDWEFSGFYPEYWECVKMTNNLTPRDRDDWYLFLPESVSPRRYPTQWLVDRIWDRNLENS